MSSQHHIHDCNQTLNVEHIIKVLYKHPYKEGASL